MREAEVKHSRLAMLAAAGWPISELLDGPLSKLFGLPNVFEQTAGRAPSLFNHLLDGPQGAFLLLATLGTAYLEVTTLVRVRVRVRVRVSCPRHGLPRGDYAS